MDTKVKQLWIKALRSGKYKQGRKRLHQRVGKVHYYCCLGVLCDLAAKSGITEEKAAKASITNKKLVKIPFSGTTKIYEYDGRTVLLPASVRDWAGLLFEDPLVYMDNFTFTCAGLNDSGHNFEEIADLIDEQL